MRTDTLTTAGAGVPKCRLGEVGAPLNPAIQDVRILVVDDQAGALDVVVSVLRAFGFRDVHRVTSGEDGIAHLKAHRVDLIIVDLSHGSAKHMDLARFLSENENPSLQRIPMIMLTRPALGSQDPEVDSSGLGQITGATLTADSLLGRVADAVGIAVGNGKKKRVLH